MSDPAVVDKIHKLILKLLHVRHRPGMYLGNYDPQRYELFQMGLEVACQAFGISFQWAADNIYETVAIEHGWDSELSDEPLRQQMQKKGIDNRTILNTLIDVDIEVLKRRYNVDAPVI